MKKWLLAATLLMSLSGRAETLCLARLFSLHAETDHATEQDFNQSFLPSVIEQTKSAFPNIEIVSKVGSNSVSDCRALNPFAIVIVSHAVSLSPTRSVLVRESGSGTNAWSLYFPYMLNQDLQVVQTDSKLPNLFLFSCFADHLLTPEQKAAIEKQGTRIFTPDQPIAGDRQPLSSLGPELIEFLKHAL